MREQILVFCYHKSGTVLFRNVLARICARLGLSLSERFGMVPFVDPGPDVVLLCHSLLGALPQRKFRAVRIIRDPRDIWVSGYLYHRHCVEQWCVNTNLDPAPPIGFPRVPLAFAHRRERWKRAWLDRLGGQSYQANLLARDRAAGLAFEMEGYTAGTLEDMQDWRYRDAGILDVKMEQIAADYDGTMSRVLRELGFAPALVPELMPLAGAEDIGRMDDAAIAARPHIHGREISKWRGILTEDQAGAFARRYAGLLAALGYGDG